MKIHKLFSVVAIFGLLAIAASALAATGDYVPLVQIPGIPAGANFLQYLSGIYNFLISIVGILAMASLVYGGFRYLTSVGNPAAVEDAKDIINSAIIGLVLALSSWLILNEINPDILVLKKPGQIGGATDKYAYGQTSFAKCFTNVDDPGYGTQANPCRCVDGTEQYSTKTKTNLILSMSPTNPAPSAPSGSLTASGKLTDDKGNGISGKTVKINRVNADLNASSTFTTTTTAPDGSFSYTTPVPCSDTATRQAIFDGDSTYTFAVSNSVALTIGGTPNCATSSYMKSPADVSILSTSFCQNLCSVKNFASDTKYHCLKAVMKALVTKDLPYETWGENSRTYDTPENSLTIPNNTWIAWNGLNYSNNYPTYPNLTPPIQYCFDGLPSPSTSNGVCDLVTEGGSGNARATGNVLYNDFAGKSNCSTITNPASIQCKFNYIIQDSSATPVSSSTNLYIRILKP